MPSWQNCLPCQVWNKDSIKVEMGSHLKSSCLIFFSLNIFTTVIVNMQLFWHTFLSPRGKRLAYYSTTYFLVKNWIIKRCSSSVFLLGFDPHSPQTLHNTSCNPRAIHHGRIHKKSYSPYALCPSKSSLSCFKSSWDMDSSIFINFIQIWTGAVN